MTEVETPIVAGALYEDVDGQEVRIKSVWVDEDLTTQVRITWKEENIVSPKSETFDLESFVDMINPNHLQRINSDHEAWEWRQ